VCKRKPDNVGHHQNVMAHLISPISIDGTLYCCKCQGGRSTKGVLTDDYIVTAGNSATITTDCGEWEIFTGGSTSDEGEISFGVSCGSSVEIYFDSTEAGSNDTYDVGIDIYIDGGYHTTVVLSEFFSEDTVDVPITGSPCGSIITAYCVPSGFSSGTYDVTATMEVLSIT